MPLAIKINVALREQNCQKIGSERVNYFLFYCRNYIRIQNADFNRNCHPFGLKSRL